jgi:hypothetical protein
LIAFLFLTGCTTDAGNQNKKIEIVESCLQTQRTSQECLDIANELVK